MEAEQGEPFAVLFGLSESRGHAAAERAGAVLSDIAEAVRAARTALKRHAKYLEFLAKEREERGETLAEPLHTAADLGDECDPGYTGERFEVVS
jgi:hypothetical protein